MSKTRPTVPPNSPDQMTRPFRTDKGDADVSAMRTQLAYAISQGVGEIQRQARNENVRYCRWSGQRDNGRKGSGETVTPFPGASDVRVRLADMVVLDDVALMLTAARDGRLSVDGTDSGEMADAAKISSYVDWMRRTKIADNVNRETRIAAEFRQTLGYTVMAVTWNQEWAMATETVTLDAIRAAAAESPGSAFDGIAQAIEKLDPETEAGLVKLLTAMYEDCDAACAREQIKSLRETGEMKVPVRYLRRNEPRWQALRPWRDWFAPTNTFGSESARWQAQREVLTAQELDGKSAVGWSDEFIDAVRSTMGFSIIQSTLDTFNNTTSDTPFRSRVEEMLGLCEVFYIYYWNTNDDGIPELWRTVISPWIINNGTPRDAVVNGPDEPLGYDIGKYPFVFMPTEQVDRYLIDARGRPETLMTQQAEIKHIRDARINQTDLALQPPIIRPEREIGLPLEIRPRGEIGYRRTGQTSFMMVPQQAQGAAPLEAEAFFDANRYIARDRQNDPVRSSAREKNFVAEWCAQLAECWKMTLQLCQQFASDAEFQQVVGGKPTTIRVSREEIQGNPHLKLLFNSDTLDSEKMKAKLEMFQILSTMNDGTLIPSPVIAEFITHNFPEIAETAIRSQNEAQTHEIKETADTLGRILGAGIEPDYADGGQNFALRLQWLDQQLQQPATQQSMAQSPDKAELVQKYQQHLQFMAQQRMNAQTGRVGVQAGDVTAPSANT